MNYIKKLFLSLALVIPGVGIFAQVSDSTVLTNKVTGIVYDAATLQPIEIADVSCMGISSTFTDLAGAFELNVQSLNDIITVKAMGYLTKDVVLAGRNKVNVYLYDVSYKSFQEEANLGYSTQKVAYTTKAIGTANQMGEKFKKGITSLESAFDGQFSGLDVRSRSGVPGIGGDLLIRGYSSLYANNQPLVVVDGMMYDINTYDSYLISGYRNNPLAGIDVNDIENVTVVKDAVSVYGAKASNGVIFIRTNHAKQQATTIDFHMYGGVNMQPEGYPLLEANDHKLLLNELLLSKGMTGEQIANQPFMVNDPAQSGYYRYNNNTDWQKEVFTNSFTSNYGLKIKGGDDVALYALSVGYLKQGGVINGSDNTRFNLRFNSDINFTKQITLNANIAFSYMNKNIGATGYPSTDDVLYQARIKAPFLHPYLRTDDGIITPNFELYDVLGVGNPTAIMDKDKFRDMNYRFFGSFNFNYKISPDITISNLVGLSFDKDRQSIFVPGEGSVPDTMELGVAERKAKESVLRHLALNNDFRAAYNKRLGYYHTINAIVGARVNMNTNELDWGADYNAANDQIRTLGDGISLLKQKGGFIGEWNSVNYYLSCDYDFMKKYFLNVSASLDGSSRFGDEAAQAVKLQSSNFGLFPSVSGAWLISSENFMNTLNGIDLLKVRGSFGITGNDDIGNYTAKKYYTTTNFLNIYGVISGNLYNPELKWETNTKINVGLDLAILHERVSLSVDAYQNTTSDMLDHTSVSVLSGYQDYVVNNGSFTTKGVDLSFNARLINKPVKWDVGFVVSKYKINVVEINGGSKITNVFGANVLTQEGNPLGVFYGYKTNGVYSTQSQADAAGMNARLENTSLVQFGAGDVIFQNMNNDNVIDESDMVVIGDPNPDFTGELYSKLKWKSLTLDASMSFSIGGDIYNYARYQLEGMSNMNNQTLAVLNRWQYEGQSTSMPKATYGDPLGNNRFSDRWIEDGSFARLRQVTLSYVLPFKVSFLKNSEVYVSGLNLATITKYKGMDPDFSLKSSPLSQGIDLGLVPQTPTILVGIKIGL